ncbi:hypothetical protein [Streptomyces sp. NPDC018833]|uniref:hypothetical protein n=1 Tax=Streptomyces sp. NPDC018833 TaxID=3365053 RepID=UPI00378762E0
MANEPISSAEEIEEAFQRARSAWYQTRPRGLAGDFDGVQKQLDLLGKAWQRAGQHPTVPRPVAGVENPLEAVGKALRAVDGHASVLAGQDLWAELREARAATKAVRNTATSLAGDAFWGQLRNNQEWRTFWHRAEANSSAAYARLSAALADRLEGTSSEPRTQAAVAALRDLQNAAAEYSTRLREADPDKAMAAEASSEQVKADLDRMHHPYTGYGPLGGAAHSQEDLRRIHREVVQASRKVTDRYSEWIATDSGKSALRSSASVVRAFRQAWKDLPPENHPGGPTSLWDAAGRYGKVAATAHAMAQAVRHQNSVPAAEVALLDALADDAHAHASRLVRTLPPGNDPSARAYRSPGEALETGQDVAGDFRTWRGSDMAKKLLQHPNDPRVRAFGSAWRGLLRTPNHSAAFDARSAAVAYAEAAKQTRLIAEAAEKSVRYPYKGSDIEELRRVAAAAEKHAGRLAAGSPPHSVVPSSPALERRREQSASLGAVTPGTPLPDRPGAVRPGVKGAGLG